MRVLLLTLLFTGCTLFNSEGRVAIPVEQAQAAAQIVADNLPAFDVDQDGRLNRVELAEFGAWYLRYLVFAFAAPEPPMLPARQVPVVPKGPGSPEG